MTCHLGAQYYRSITKASPEDTCCAHEVFSEVQISNSRRPEWELLTGAAHIVFFCSNCTICLFLVLVCLSVCLFTLKKYILLLAAASAAASRSLGIPGKPSDIGFG